MTKRIGIRIDPDDNVVTVVEDAGPEDEINFVTGGGSQRIVPRQATAMGHKVALRDIEAGEKIIKYGQTIGTAAQDIRQGDHVHVHNVRSAVQGMEDES